MKQPTLHSLDIKWTTSRGRDTYGWNICTLTDDRGARFRTMGGGYDMTSAVLGDWIAEKYQDRLYRMRWYAATTINNRGMVTHNDNSKALYGMTLNRDSVTLDGRCGESSMRQIASAIGLDIKNTYSQRKGRHSGFIISDRRAQA